MSDEDRTRATLERHSQWLPCCGGELRENFGKPIRHTRMDDCLLRPMRGETERSGWFRRAITCSRGEWLVWIVAFVAAGWVIGYGCGRLW